MGVSSGDADFNTVNKTGGDKTVTLTVDQMPSHRHGWYGLNDGAGWTGHAGTYPFRIYQDREYNWEGSEHCVKYAGGGQAHTNLQPYVTCYMWRRTV